MGAIRTRQNWLVLAALAATILAVIGFRYAQSNVPKQMTDRAQPANGNGESNYESDDAPLTPELTFEAPVVGEAFVTLPDETISTNPTYPLPGDNFSPREYSHTTERIFRDFWRNALAWTLVDYRVYADHIEQLDGRAAYQVYAYLRTCLDQPKTQEAVERRIRRYERSRRPREWQEAMVQRQIDSLLRCEGLEELGDLNLLALKWLTIAADRAYPQAQVAYYKSPRWLLNRSRDAVFRQPELAFEYRDRATGFLNAAIRTGHPDALLEYGDALHDGIIFPRDPISAYAYAYAADLAADNDHREAQRKLATFEIGLAPAEIRRAKELGRNLCERYCNSVVR